MQVWYRLCRESVVVATVVLICSVFASLAGGVLLAYSICNAMFNLFRIHSIQVAQQRAARRDAQQLASAQMDAAI
jgi:MFS superfamily sulfate permease-like transporter